VSHLEYISQGVTAIACNLNSSVNAVGSIVNGASSPSAVFPEPFIRELAGNLLQRIASAVAEEAGVYARVKGAMVHSGNPKLRANILSGLIYLRGRAPSIGRYFRSNKVCLKWVCEIKLTDCSVDTVCCVVLLRRRPRRQQNSGVPNRPRKTISSLLHNNPRSPPAPQD
jgi:hypothetical protein